MRISNRVLAVLAVAGAALLAWGLIRWNQGDDLPRLTAAPRAPFATTAPASTTGRALSTGSGSGNEVSDDFTVPDGCGRQELAYRGRQTESSGGFINFRVYDTTGFPGDNPVGPIDLDEEQAGSALWTMDAGTYSIEITADGARWEYTLTCR